MDKQIIIVTGAGHGIGKSIAETFSANGYRVIIADINTENGQKVAEDICNSGNEAFFHQTDVSKPSDLERLMQMVHQRSGRIDILVNNAGLSEFYDPLEISEEKWDHILATNLKSVFFASREAAKLMKQTGGGAIINIASTRAIMSEPNSEAYAASKGGILALTHALAASFSKYNITVNAILPGWIETRDYSALTELDHSQHFSNRVGKPDDIARACIFLAKQENNFISGSQLVIDGGMTRKMIYED